MIPQKTESAVDKNTSCDDNFPKDHNKKPLNVTKNEINCINSNQPPSVKFTANIKSDLNKITLLFEKVENHKSNKNKDLTVSDDNCNKIDTQTYLTTNNNVNDIPVESLESSQFADNTDVSRTTEYKLSFLTSSDTQTQTSWFKKILRCCKCGK